MKKKYDIFFLDNLSIKWIPKSSTIPEANCDLLCLRNAAPAI